MGGLKDLTGPLITPLLARALRAFVSTAVVMATGGVLGAAAAWEFAGPEPAWKGPVAGAAALLLFVGLGAFLATHRAVGAALGHALGELRVGSRLVAALFRQLLEVTEDDPHGARGTAVARAAERVPLAQAEQRVRGTVARLLSAPSDGGGLGGRLRRRLEATLMARIETLTLARFRDEDARAGGVDLVKVRDELSAHVDELIADHVRSALTRMTVLVALGACLGAAMIGWIVRSL